jgi:hypothetical protein
LRCPSKDSDNLVFGEAVVMLIRALFCQPATSDSSSLECKEGSESSFSADLVCLLTFDAVE